MQYTGLINYKKCMEHGLNLSQGAVMDSMLKLSSRASGIEVDGEIYYFLSTGKMVEMLPVISEKKNTFVVIIKKLIDLGLLDRIIIGVKSYYKLSALGKLFDRTDEKNHQDPGKKSSVTHEKNHDNTSISNTGKKIKVKNTCNTVLGDPKTEPLDNDILSVGDIPSILDHKNTNTSKSSPRGKKSSVDRDYFNEKNTTTLLGIISEAGVSGILRETIKKHTRLMQALGGIKGDESKIEEAISTIDFTNPDCLTNVANEIYRLYLSKYNN